MSTRLRRDAERALGGFYQRGKHSFWQEYDQTPEQALKAFCTNPAVFGPMDADLTSSPGARQHERIIGLLMLMRERMT